MAARDPGRIRRTPVTGLAGLLASEATELGDLARRAVPTRRRAGVLGLALLALLALSGVAGASEPDPDNRSALDAWGDRAVPAASAPAGPAASSSAASASAASTGALPADPIPADAPGTSALFAGPDLFDLGLKALLVIVALFVTLRILKRVQGGGATRRPGSLLDVMETRTIGPKAQLHLVAVGDRRLIVGQTPSGLVALGELDAAELPSGDAAAILEALGINADEPAPDQRNRPDPVRPGLAPGRGPASRPMDVRVAAYARPIAGLDPVDDLDDLAPVRSTRPPRLAPQPSVQPSIVAPAPRHTAPSVDARVARAAARARADRTADAARAERRSRVDRALAAADRAAFVAERTAEAAARALAAADLEAAERSRESVARTRATAPATAPATARRAYAPAPAAASRAARPSAPPRGAAPTRGVERAPADLIALAVRLAAAGREREAQVERAAASIGTTAAAPSESIASILASLAAEPAEQPAAERPRAPHRIEMSA